MEKKYKISVKYPTNDRVLTHYVNHYKIIDGMISFRYFDNKQIKFIDKVVDSRLCEIEVLQND